MTTRTTATEGNDGDGPRRGRRQELRPCRAGALRARRADAWRPSPLTQAGGGPPQRADQHQHRVKQRLTGGGRAARATPEARSASATNVTSHSGYATYLIRTPAPTEKRKCAHQRNRTLLSTVSNMTTNAASGDALLVRAQASSVLSPTGITAIRRLRSG